MFTIRPFDYSDADYEVMYLIDKAIFPQYEITAAEWKHMDESRDPKYLFQREMIALDGDMTLKSATTGGTSVPDYFAGGFNKTQLVDPTIEPNNGQRGMVSAIVLSFTTEKNLPLVGTESVLAIEVESAVDQTEEPIEGGRVYFKSGLKGAGQPVENAITISGGTEKACNFDTAEAKVVFVKPLIPPMSLFRRGNANDDGKVDIADAIWIINELFRGGPPTVCADAADANDDGVRDAADAVYLINYLFTAGPAPTSPFPDCGADPGADPTTCMADQTGC